MSDKINDLIDEWHSRERLEPLHGFLGMTLDEYAKWVEGANRCLKAEARVKQLES